MAENSRIECTDTPCLRCLIWDAINRVSPCDASSGGHLYDAEEILSHLAEVMAEIIASHPPPLRRKLISELPEALNEWIEDLVRSGDVLPGLPKH